MRRRMLFNMDFANIPYTLDIADCMFFDIRYKLLRQFTSQCVSLLYKVPESSFGRRSNDNNKCQCAFVSIGVMTVVVIISTLKHI
jgi:hypothetical protein